MTWHTEPLRGFDLETSGVDVETDRIVTAAITDYGTPTDSTRTWLADPGIDIPAEATAVHGIPTEHAQAHGRPAADVAEEIAQALVAAMETGTPIVAMNGRFDFTILDRELRRYGLPTLEERLGRPVGPVIDPFVIDKQADKYRRGSRKLEALAAHYGVTLTDAHTAGADAVAALEVAVAIAERYPQLQVDADQLHAWQIKWAADQAADFQAYKRRTDPTAVIDGAWPLVPFRDELTETRGHLDAMRLVIAVHLAEMLLDDQGNEVKRWARGIAFELDRIGVNIDAAVEARVQQLAPGTPPVQPSNAPF